MYHRLANGIELVVCPRDGANVLSVQCVVWVGSLDETDDEQGFSHFIEHMLFKGTEKRGVGKIAGLVEAAGGESNAYTTFDRTVFHLTLPSDRAELGFDVLSDAIFSSVFHPVELEKEREVILEEIRREQDSPAAQIGRAIYEDIYHGTAAARSIIGRSGHISKATRDSIMRFWRRWYQPQNMSIVVSGHIAESEALKLVDQYFGAQSDKLLESPGSGRHRNLRRRRPGRIRSIVLGRDVEQSRLHIILGAPSIDSPDCPLVDTAAYVLGGSEVSRLQTRLQEKEAVVNAIGASSYSSSFEGTFEISAILDSENIKAACTSIARELELMLGREPATEKEIERSRAAARIAKIHREETVDGIASALVAGLGTPLKEKFEGYYDYLSGVFKPGELTAALNRSWDLRDALIVVLCDNAKKPMGMALENAFADGLALASKVSVTRPTEAVHAKKSVKVHEFEIGNGNRAIYREIPGAKLFSLTAATDGGQRAETEESAGLFHAMAGLIGLASKRRDYRQFVGRLEDIGALLSGFSGKDSVGLNMQCTIEHAEEMIFTAAECLLEPVFPPDQWQVNLRETLESMKLQMDSFEWACMRRLFFKVFGNHPYSLPFMGFESSLKDLSATKLQSGFESWRDGGRWVFGLAGGAPVQMVQDSLSKAFAGFKPKTAARLLEGTIKVDLGPEIFAHLPKRTNEQAQLAIGALGPRWSSSNREATDLLITILGGQGGRLFSILREDESLAYSVGPLHTQGMAGGLVGAHMATAKEKVDRAKISLERELHKVSSIRVAPEELERSRAFLLGSHEISLQRTSSQAMTMALMELYGLGWDDFQTYTHRMKLVTSEDVSKAAAEYFETSALNLVTVGV